MMCAQTFSAELGPGPWRERMERRRRCGRAGARAHGSMASPMRAADAIVCARARMRVVEGCTPVRGCARGYHILLWAA